MLIETDTGGEREIGANPYEHSSPMGVLDIEVILIDPTPLHLEMPTIVFPDGGHEGGGLTCLDRKSTRLNSSHGYISYAVFCLKKKKNKPSDHERQNFINPDTTRTHRQMTLAA